MIRKYLAIIFGLFLAVPGAFVLLFTHFIYGHVSWINTDTFQINIPLMTPIAIFVFLLGLLVVLKNTTHLFDVSPKILVIIRKAFAVILLCVLLYVLFYAGLFGVFLWLMFFNVALVFCIYLLLTKYNGYFAGFFFALLGSLYALAPVFAGPPIWMDIFSDASPFVLNDGTKTLLYQVFFAKALTLVIGMFLLFAAFFKKPQQQEIS